MLNLFLVLGALTAVLLILFAFFSSKEKKNSPQESVFECGYTSYFFSHISISMHYFMIGLIFLFLDLEMCYLIPFLNEGIYCSSKKNYIILFFVTALLLTLIYEWLKNNLEWKF